MNDETLEQISAMTDGELKEGSRFILHTLATNEAYKGAWGRYHLIGECLRGHLPVRVDPQLADRISKAIQNEPQGLGSSRPRRFLQPVAGLAIAATVAAVAILGVRQIGSGPATPDVAYNAPGASTNSDYKTVTAAAGNAQQVPVRAYVTTEEDLSRLNRYLVNYNEHRSTSGVQGTMPYVRIVAHEVEE